MSTSRVQEYLLGIPLVTKSLLFFNIAIHIIIFLTSFPIQLLAIHPLLVIARGESYRIVSSAFVHGGLLHILMNMSSLIALGTALENSFGSLKLLFITLWSIIGNGIVYIFMAWAYSKATMTIGSLNSSAVGYSGVLFCYALIESFHSFETSRSVFGLFSVPTKSYPFILLIILQFIMPNISLMGHLAGIIMGILIISGPGNNILFPSSDCLNYLDDLTCFGFINRSSSFSRNKDKDLIHSDLNFSSSSSNQVTGVFGSILNFIWMILGYIGNILSTGLHILGISSENFQGFSNYFSSNSTPTTDEDRDLEGASNINEGINRPSSVFSGRGRTLRGEYSRLPTDENPTQPKTTVNV